MTKGEFSKGVTIRLITAVVFGVIGGFAIYYALQMVAIFGEGMGVDARSKEIYAHSHMVVHLFGAACSLAIGVFILNRSRFLTSLAILALFTCGGYGILNMVGFTSTNRVSVAAAKDAGNAATEREYKLARADLEKQIEWANKTASQEEGREKRRLLTYIDAKRKELSALKAPRPTAENVLSDAQASVMAELTNTNARTWLLALPIPLAVLLFFAESFSFVVVGHMLSGAIALIVGYRAVSPGTDTASGSGNSGSGGGGKSKPELPRQRDTGKASNITPLRASDTGDTGRNSPAKSAIQKRLPENELIDVLERELRKGLAVSQRALAQRTGWSQPSVHRKLKHLRGKRKPIFRNAQPYLNGGSVSMSV